MFGFIFAAACLAGLIYTLRRPYRWHGGWGAHRHGVRGPMRRHLLGRLFRRLDTTPGQEREIRAALEELEDAAGGFKRDVFASREGLAQAIRGEHLDEAALAGLFADHDSAIGELRSAFSAAASRVHGVLDERQRERLAETLERGARRWHGPYRSPA